MVTDVKLHFIVIVIRQYVDILTLSRLVGFNVWASAELMTVEEPWNQLECVHSMESRSRRLKNSNFTSPGPCVLHFIYSFRHWLIFHMAVCSLWTKDHFKLDTNQEQSNIESYSSLSIWPFGRKANAASTYGSISMVLMLWPHGMCSSWAMSRSFLLIYLLHSYLFWLLIHE